MKKELDVACNFLANFMKASGLVGEDRVENFTEIFRVTFENCYSSCWHPTQPLRGSGNRCLGVQPFRMDPLLVEVAVLANIDNLADTLPKEFTLWIDPGCVCYRFRDNVPPFYLLESSVATLTESVLPIAPKTPEATAEYNATPSSSSSTSPVTPRFLFRHGPARRAPTVNSTLKGEPPFLRTVLLNA